MSKNFVRTLCAGIAAFALATSLASASPDKPVIGIVVKM
jgi:simple sugar transport system substrate-binding protein